MSEFVPSITRMTAQTGHGFRRRSRSRSGTMIALLAIIAVTAAALMWWWTSDPTEAILPRTVLVTQGDVSDVVSALGTLQPASYVDVGAQVSGQLTKLNAAIGDHVTAGQLLAELDARVLQSRLSTDTAELARLNGLLAEQAAQLDLAKAQAERQRAMFRGNATSRDQLDTALAQVHVLQAQIVQTKAQISGQEAQISADKTNLSFTRIAAPMTGTVVSVTAVQGQTLNVNQSAPILLRIADLSTMTVEVQVSEADQPKLKIGMPVRFHTLGRPNETRQGALRQIYPTPEVVNNVTLYTALFDVANPNGQLLPQMSVQAFFVRAEAHDVPVVPLSAVSHEGNGGAAASVRVLDDAGQILTRPVQIGVSDRIVVAVTAGLKVGDRVVLPVGTGKGGGSGGRSSGPRL